MLLKKIKSKKINVLIAGCGYTGYPLADLISKQGIKVVGYDINRKLVNKLNSLKNKQNKYLSFTHNINTIKKIDIILISLPTPLIKKF